MPRSLVALLCLLALVGCHSSRYADRGAAFGGLTGAGVGAIVGDQLGSAGAGTAIGAGIGALTGAAVGDAMDEIDANNRAAIAAQLGRQVQPGAATVDEVVALSRAGVDPRLITTHIQRSGVAAPASVADVIYLHEQGVSTEVIQAMQTGGAPPSRVAQPPPGPVIIEEHHYPAPPYPPRIHYHHRFGRRPRVGWGFSFSG